MSRGLSRQQLQILGLATAVSRLRYGAPKAHTPVLPHGYRYPIVSKTYRDICVALAAHVLGGVRWFPETTLGTRHNGIKQEKTPAMRSASNSIGRSINNLIERELLAHIDWWSVYEWGFVLTTPGLAIGLLHELRVAELERRVWLLAVPAKKQPRPEWHVYEPLPSPEVLLRADSMDHPDVAYAGSLKPIVPEYWERVAAVGVPAALEAPQAEPGE